MSLKLYSKAFEIVYTSRILDKKIMMLIKQSKAHFHMGASGHEIVQAAMALSLDNQKDWVYPYYRDQALCLGLDMSIKELLLGYLAKDDDPSSGGRQLPHHFGSKKLNIVSASSSVGTQFLQAVGTALANKKQFSSSSSTLMPVTVVSGGEGSTSQGEFYEAINWAAVDKLPLVFFIQNNGYAISVPSTVQKPNGNISVLGKLYENVLSYEVNGCNFFESFDCVQNALRYSREVGPVFICANVVRIAAHSSSDNQKDYRPKSELDFSIDPINILKKTLIDKDIMRLEDIESIEKRIAKNVDETAEIALNAIDPVSEEVVEFLYSDNKFPLDKISNSFDEQGSNVVFIDAINRALDEEMEKNPNMYVFGEDVAGEKGGVFKATRNLSKKYGLDRCFNTQLAEASIIGVAIGMAIKGFKPVVEIQFGDYIWPAMMQIKNELSTLRYRSKNNFKCPLVIRTPVGGYIHGGLCHSQNIEAFFAHIPGLRVVQPSTAFQAYGLLKYAINCEDPVLFLEHKLLYRQKIANSNLSSKEIYLPFKQAQIRKTGKHLTIISYGYLIYKTLNAVSNIESKYNLTIEVIDLVSLKPIDWKTLFFSVKKTNRCLIIHEDNKFMGLGAEISSEINSNCFQFLDAPIRRHAGLNVHIPYNSTLEDHVLPQVSSIEKAIEDILSF